MDDDTRKDRWEQRTELPLAFASLAFLASYAVRVLAPGLTDPLQDLALAVLLASWALFAVNYAVLWRLSGQGLGFVRRHPLDALVVTTAAAAESTAPSRLRTSRRSSVGR